MEMDCDPVSSTGEVIVDQDLPYPDVDQQNQDPACMVVGANEILSTQFNSKKRHQSQWCSAINCTNSRVKRPDLSFFRFPNEEERCRKWVINSRRQDLLSKSTKALHTGNTLCALHFEDSEFTNDKRNQLKQKKAVPTVFDIPNPPSAIKSKRPPPKERTLPVPITGPQLVKVQKEIAQPSTSSQSNISHDTYYEDDVESVDSDDFSGQDLKNVDTYVQDPIQIANISAITTIDPSNPEDSTTVSFTDSETAMPSDRKDFVFHNSVTPPTTVTLPTGTFVPQINVVSQTPSTSQDTGGGRRKSPRIVPQTLLITNRPHNTPVNTTKGLRSGKKRKASPAQEVGRQGSQPDTKTFSVSLEKKSEADYFGYFVTEVLKSMAPDTRSWCQMEMSKIIHTARSGNWKKAAAATAASATTSACVDASASASSTTSTPISPIASTSTSQS